MSVEDSLKALNKDVLGGLGAISDALEIIIEGQEKMIAGENVDWEEEDEKIRQLFANIGKK